MSGHPRKRRRSELAHGRTREGGARRCGDADPLRPQYLQSLHPFPSHPQLKRSRPGDGVFMYWGGGQAVGPHADRVSMSPATGAAQGERHLTMPRRFA